MHLGSGSRLGLQFRATDRFRLLTWFTFCAYATRLPVHILRICNLVAGSHSTHMQPGCRFTFCAYATRLQVHILVHLQSVAGSRSGSFAIGYRFTFYAYATRLPVHIPVHMQPGCRFTFRFMCNPVAGSHSVHVHPVAGSHFGSYATRLSVHILCMCTRLPVQVSGGGLDGSERNR